MKYLVPMAGEDDLFPRAEYHFPKPLIEIDGVPMVARFIENIRRSLLRKGEGNAGCEKVGF